MSFSARNTPQHALAGVLWGDESARVIGPAQPLTAADVIERLCGCGTFAS
jgi:hypothetical protein